MKIQNLTVKKVEKLMDKDIYFYRKVDRLNYELTRGFIESFTINRLGKTLTTISYRTTIHYKIVEFFLTEEEARKNYSRYQIALLTKEQERLDLEIKRLKEEECLKKLN